MTEASSPTDASSVSRALPVPGDAALARLLEVQQADTTADQLAHRVQHSAEQAAVDGLERELATETTALGQVQARRAALGKAQTALEEQIETARRRRDAIDQRMRSGAITAARELAVLDEEVRHLAEHIRGLEDRELEVMEELEPVDAELAERSDRVAELRQRLEAARAAVAELQASVDRALGEVAEQRAAAAADLPSDLLERYERIRARAGGVGAARLVGSACSGCHLELPSMEVDRIRKAPPGTVVTCEQCGRILVR